MDGFTYQMANGRLESGTSVTEQEAMLILQRMIGLASRTAVGDGLGRAVVAALLRDEADAIEFQDCAEDMSPIVFPMA